MNLLSLEGKTCLITGSSQGIGFQTANLFVQHGAKVFISSRDENSLNLALEKIKSNYPKSEIFAIKCDVSIESEVKLLFQTIFKTHKSSLDVLVANAGILESSLIGMVTKEHLNKIFSINTFGYIYCCQYASRLMMRNSMGGSIIGISSIMGLSGYSGYSIYSGSKAAIIGVTKSLSKELATSKIRVNCLSPGYIQTNMTQGLPDKNKEEVMKMIGMGRFGNPQDVANAVLFLASDMSSYITGEVLSIDGGMAK